MPKYFAEIKDNIVQRVIVANDIQWCIDKLGGEWVETFQGNPVKNYAGIGYIYYPSLNNFSAPQPFPSWILNEKTCLWGSPIPYPEDGKFYKWDEKKVAWIERTIE